MVVALLAARLMDELGGFLPAGAFESFRTDLHLDYTHASAVLVAAAPGAIVGNVFSIAADHRSRRVIATLGAAGDAVALLGYAAGHTFAVLVLASFLLGMMATALVDGSELALADLAGDDLVENLARANMLGSIGDLAGPALLIGAAAVGVGWRGTFVVAAVAMALYAAWLATLPLPPPRAEVRAAGAREGLRAALRSPWVWYLGVIAFLAAPLDEALLAFVIADLQQAHGLGTGAATAIASLSIVGTLVGFATVSRHTSLVADVALATTSVVLLALGPVPVIAVAAFAFGIGLGRTWVVVHTRVLSVMPGRGGTVSAVVSTIEFTGFVLPLLAGRAADHAGVRAALLVEAAIAVALLLVVAIGERARGRRERQARRARAI